MAYKLFWEIRAQEDLRCLDKAAARRIINKVAGHLPKDPLNLATAMKGNLTGLYRYRVGDYRVIFALDLEHQAVKVLRIGHRKNVYD